MLPGSEIERQIVCQVRHILHQGDIYREEACFSMYFYVLDLARDSCLLGRRDFAGEQRQPHGICQHSDGDVQSHFIYKLIDGNVRYHQHRAGLLQGH